MRYGVEPGELQTLASAWAERGEAARGTGGSLGLAVAASSWCDDAGAAATAEAALAAVLSAVAAAAAGHAYLSRSLDAAAQAYQTADRPVPR